MKGKVINLGDGRPWLVVQSTSQTGYKAGYVYVMAMYNYGNATWGPSNQTPANAISTTSDSGSVYTGLPTTIGGITKANAFSSNTWQWDMCSTASPATCSNTTTSTSRLSFVSFREWQGGTGGFATEPTSGSVGNLFCQAWKGTNCLGSILRTTFNWPWARSGVSTDSYAAWTLYGHPSASLSDDAGTGSSFGSLPVAWLTSNLCTNSGAGTFASPYTLSSCNTTPTISALSAPVNNSWAGTTLSVAGTVSDSDSSQTLTIQYQLDGTNGTWNTLTTTTSPASSKSFSASVSASGLSAGSHTLYVRVTDGTATSANVSRTFNIDVTRPTFTLSPTPTGINNWTTATTVTITPVDTGGAGIAETRYATTNVLNSTCTSGGSVYAAPITLSSGTNNLYVCVRDAAGNVSTSATAYNTANVYQVNRTATQPSPEPTIENSVANIGAFASYVSGYSSLILSGTAHDSDSGQTLTIQYQIDGTAGAWTNLTTLAANANNQGWSAAVDLANSYPGLAAGSHTVYVRVYDGYSYSANKTLAFVLDTTALTTNASLTGGTKCAHDNTIYCVAPTSVKLSMYNGGLNQSLIEAYRHQWTNSFTDNASTPAWIVSSGGNNVVANYPISGHATPAQTHILYYQTRDKVGNVSPVESISYYINSPPTISLDSADNNHVVTAYTPLILSGKIFDLDTNQTQVVSIAIDGVDYQSQTYQTLGGEVVWSLIVDASHLQGLSAEKLTNLSVTVTDSAGVLSTTYYTGQITLATNSSAEIYLTVMKNVPFSLTIGKIGAFNLIYGTNYGVTVAQNNSSEIVVSGELAEASAITFGVTKLVFTVFDEPTNEIQEVEFI